VGLKLPMGIQRQAALLGSAVQRGYLRPGDVQRRHVAWLKQRQGGGHATAWVQHHANRVGPIDMAHGELGVVGRSGAGAHHHGIGQGAQPVQVYQAFRAVDVVGMAPFMARGFVNGMLPDLSATFDAPPMSQLRHWLQEDFGAAEPLPGTTPRTTP